MDSGYIKLFRKIQDNPLWLKESFTHSQAWIDLLLLTNYKDGGYWVQGIYVPVKRGQCGWSEINLAKRWKWSRGKVRRFFELLIQQAQIERKTVQSHKRLSGLIIIINYDEYQSDGTIDGTIDGQSTDNRRYSNKKEKKEKKEKNKDLKNIYGEFENVNLTPDEHQKLTERFGKDGVTERVEKLSVGIASKGYKYKSHYATILSWEAKNGRNQGHPTITQTGGVKPAPGKYDNVGINLEDDIDGNP